jgi:hypothetical protein
VVSSVLLVLVVTAVLLSGLGAVVPLAAIVVAGLVACGVLEGPAVRLATRAGTPTDGELQVLFTVPDLEQPLALVGRSAASTTAPVVMMSRFTVVSATLVEALGRGRVSTREVTALVTHARAHHWVAAARTVEVRATAAGDAAVVAAGLGGVFVEVLDRSGHQLPLARRQRLLASPTSGPLNVTRLAPHETLARRLHLVRS